MNLTRLGDLIESKQRPSEKSKPYWTADFLAQKVFNAEQDAESVSEWYVQSEPIASDLSLTEELPDDVKELGEFEAKILGKLLKPKRPVLVIRGPMGCGKSSTKDYVVSHVLANRKHCGVCPHPRERMIAKIDFNDHIDLNQFEGDKLDHRLFSIICDELVARINMNTQFSKHEEYTKFWQYEVDRFRIDKTPSIAFRAIIANFDDISAHDFSMLSKDDLKLRKKVLHNIKKDGRTYLDYLVRIIQYIIRVHYKGNRGCCVIVLDNIDAVNPVVQHQIIRLVRSSAKYEGPTFLLLVRPETSDQGGLGTKVIDIENHKGPTPRKVVFDRIRRFCENPDGFFESYHGLSQEQYELIKSFIANFQSNIEKDTKNAFTKFLESASGSSIRLGLLIAQNLFRVSDANMKDQTILFLDIVRTCLTKGKPQLQWSRSYEIEHIFLVSDGGYKSVLVKPRVLRYLGRQDNRQARLNEIYNTLYQFGYSEELTRSAINDLMRIQCQLIRSNGFDIYHKPGSLDKYGGDIVKLTVIGRNYVNDMLRNVHYIQEVMLDTIVDGDHFPLSIKFGYLSDKLRLLYLFLKEIHEIDCDEMWKFTES